jgi:hypothetical protein
MGIVNVIHNWRHLMLLLMLIMVLMLLLEWNKLGISIA